MQLWFLKRLDDIASESSGQHKMESSAIKEISLNAYYNLGIICNLFFLFTLVYHMLVYHIYRLKRTKVGSTSRRSGTGLYSRTVLGLWTRSLLNCATWSSSSFRAASSRSCSSRSWAASRSRSPASNSSRSAARAVDARPGWKILINSNLKYNHRQS